MTHVTVIQHVHIFDGSHVLPDDTVVVQDSTITAVGSNLVPPPGATIVDGTGRTLLPGLIDAHTHTFGPALQQALIFGVTTELDMFTDWRLAQSMKEQQVAGEGEDLPDLRSAGTAITAPGGHGTQFGLTIPTITGPLEAQEFVDARIAEGSDYIKIMYDDGKSRGRSFNNISRETLAALVEATHQRGKLAVVHILAYQAACDAVEVGADVLAHLFFDQMPADADFGHLVADHHACVIPTLTVLESVTGGSGGIALVNDAWLAPYLSREDIGLLQSKYPPHGTNAHPRNAEAALRQLKAAGVPILAGTDASMPGTLHGASIHRELELLVQAGLTPVEALTAATSRPARIFSLTDRGRIAPGLRADLVLVDGDPSRDILTTRRIIGVWKRGVEVDRRTYRARLEQEHSEAEHRPAPVGSESGLVSDFEDGQLAARFGSGWQVTTESEGSWRSTAQMQVVPEGANGGKGSLLISGEVRGESPLSWAGAVFLPGETPWEPANLSEKKGLTFWVKGDGKTYRLMIFAGRMGKASLPTIIPFMADGRWQPISVDFSHQRYQIDTQALLGVAFVAVPPAGQFVFQIAHVRFV